MPLIQVTLTGGKAVNRKFKRIERTLIEMLNTLQTLLDKVHDLRTVEESAIALITGLAQKLRDAAGDQAKIDAIVADMDSGATALAKAVADNTTATTT